jgi:DNA mismatch endonuclease (patch repair protein)
MDRYTPEQRSALMAKVSGKDTKPELVVRKLAHAMGFRYRLHRKDLPGRPDLIFPKQKLALFVHGCFWHRHEGCKKCSTPASRREFWAKKFAANVERDKRAQKELVALGWRVAIIWECETKDAVCLEKLLTGVLTTTWEPEGEATRIRPNRPEISEP